MKKQEWKDHWGKLQRRNLLGDPLAAPGAPAPESAPLVTAHPAIRRALPAIVSGKHMRSPLDAAVIQTVTADAAREADVRMAASLVAALDNLYTELDRVRGCVERTTGRAHNGYLDQAHQLAAVIRHYEADAARLEHKAKHDPLYKG